MQNFKTFQRVMGSMMGQMGKLIIMRKGNIVIIIITQWERCWRLQHISCTWMLH